MVEKSSKNRNIRILPKCPKVSQMMFFHPLSTPALLAASVQHVPDIFSLSKLFSLTFTDFHFASSHQNDTFSTIFDTMSCWGASPTPQNCRQLPTLPYYALPATLQHIRSRLQLFWSVVTDFFLYTQKLQNQQKNLKIENIANLLSCSKRSNITFKTC